MGRSSNTGVKCDTVSDASVEAHGDDDQGRCIPPPSDSLPFSEGEKVLAYHKSSIYEAKGWSKNWDEWVCLDRLMKHTEENVQKQQLLNKKHGMDRNTKTVVRGKKLRNGSINKESVHLEKIVNIHIPRTLKKQLIDDCEYITHLGKLVKIPRSPNVDDILNKYLDYRLKKDGEIADSVGEVLKGLRCYFDKALPAMLLYKSEREQYQEAISDHVSPSTVYGAEHLLRLFDSCRRIEAPSSSLLIMYRKILKQKPKRNKLSNLGCLLIIMHKLPLYYMDLGRYLSLLAPFFFLGSKTIKLVWQNNRSLPW
ncbi:protein MRG1-like isoform X2 [Malania oleifera]|uniref:protein MRG1-like isoform X2 n=1 Tax=Malania oleifera TaxID=397392 RepID=UPI0025ADC35B|nr:protein MRG1-like isoform X2 [Malania oleifera]